MNLEFEIRAGEQSRSGQSGSLGDMTSQRIRQLANLLPAGYVGGGAGNHEGGRKCFGVRYRGWEASIVFAVAFWNYFRRIAATSNCSRARLGCSSEKMRQARVARFSTTSTASSSTSGACLNIGPPNSVKPRRGCWPAASFSKAGARCPESVARSCAPCGSTRSSSWGLERSAFRLRSDRRITAGRLSGGANCARKPAPWSRKATNWNCSHRSAVRRSDIQHGAVGGLNHPPTASPLFVSSSQLQLICATLI